MRSRTRSVAAVLPLALLGAGSADAQSTMIAGWDFSQYFGSNSLAVTMPANEYSTFANYSDLDTMSAIPGLGAGAEGFGEMFHDGSFGSTNTAPSLDFAPLTGELVSNRDAPNVGTEMSTSGSINVLTTESGGMQLFGNALRMVAQADVDVVFEADRTGASTSGNLWSVSFGAQALTTPAMVTVEFSNDGSSYQSAGQVMVDTSDSRYDVPLFTDSTSTGYVRLGLVDNVTIDNVAISVPEPVAAAGGVVALLTVLALARRRD